MPEKLPLTVIVFGFHGETLQKLSEWDRQGVLSLLGVWAISTAPTCLSAQVPLLDPDRLPPAGAHTVRVIYLAEQQKVYRDKADEWQRQQRGTVILDADAFWLLEMLVEQALALQEMEKELKMFQTISMYSHEGIQLVDAAGTILYINPSFSRITNIPPEERLGKSIYDVSPNGALVQALKRREPVLGWRSTSEGSDVETISNAAPIFVDGELIGAVTTFQDVTEIKHLSLKLREREQQISHLHDQLRHVHAAQYTFADIIGESEAIQKMVELAKKAARTRSTVFITGESGTGKELFAHAIHAASEFHHKPFVVVNCAAIPAELLESELFGYEKGAFTHATKQKIGKFELANEGTIFLDEIGDMSPPLQAKILRVLQTKEVERIGGLTPIKVNVRVIAATNRNLQELVKAGKFREELYYRLNVVRLEIPPLRQRISDLPALVRVLMRRISRRTGLNPMTLTNKGLAVLAEYHWPGNVRELENFLERLMNESTSSVIPDALVQRHINKISGTGAAGGEEAQPLSRDPAILPLRVLEREHIRNALALYGHSLEGKKKAALSLGISIATLYNKIKRYQLLPQEYGDH